MELSKNFTLAELCKSQTATRHNIINIPTEQNIINNLIAVSNNILQPIRDNFGIPFSPNSGYRSPELNQLLGSKSTSQHCKGEAVDVEVPTISNLDLANWCAVHLSFDQIILEFYKEGEPTSGWVHISYNLEKNRKKYLSFDGKKYKEMK
tara:strand:- start:2971 stop:3420 length:450 start_codon:yes stop_codon:yes gene_type:complete